MELTHKVIGTVDNKEIVEHTVTNANGISLSAMTLGATLTKLVTPDKNEIRKDITLNVENVDDFVAHRPFYGATIGRVAGRITRGKFELSGKEFQLDVNEGENLLHGGPKGLDTKVWAVEAESGESEARLIYTYTSPEGENNFPGTLAVKVIYTLTDENEWIIQYEASTDAPTLFNPTNHVYFNLTGDIKKSMLDHQLKLNSDLYGSLGEENLPSGQLEKVEGTPFDFREGKAVKEAVLSDHPQISPLNGLDHPFVLNPKEKGVQATLYDPESGREVELYTDCNSVVIFTHNAEIDDYLIEGEPAKQYAGITLETQTLPDAVNQPGFGNIILRPGELFTSQTTYKFNVRKG